MRSTSSKEGSRLTKKQIDFLEGKVVLSLKWVDFLNRRSLIS